MIDKSRGLDEELNYGSLVADGIILCKDGSLLAGYKIDGRDMTRSSENVRAHTSQQANRAFKALGGGVTIYCDLISDPARTYISEEDSHFPDPATRAIDRERRQQFAGGDLETFRRTTVMCIQYTPPSPKASKLASLFFDEGDGKPTFSMTRIVEAFRKKLAAFETLAASSCTLTRMADYTVDGNLRSNLVNYLDFRIGGVWREVNLSAHSVYLDGSFAYKKLDNRSPIKLGEEFVVCVVIDGFPALGHPGILNGLAYMPAPLVWSSRFVSMERAEALHEIKKQEGAWKFKMNGFVASAFRKESKSPDIDAGKMMVEAIEAHSRVSSDEVAEGFYTSVIVLRGYDIEELNDRADEVVKVVFKAGFSARVEDFNATEAWIGTLPAHREHNVRRPPIDTRNLADLLPMESLWTGEPENPCSFYPAGSPPLAYATTHGATPYAMNLHVGDLGNVIMWGPPGNGKSAALNFLASQEFRYEGTRIWSLDYKYSMYATASACGWNHYDLGMPGGLSFCPLADIDAAEDLAAAITWLEDRFEDKEGRAPTSDQSASIQAALELLRASPLRSLSDFLAVVQDDEVRSAIAYYSLTGSAGTLLDAETDTLTTDVSAVFECEKFTSSYPKQIVAAVYAHLNRKFRRGLDGRPFGLYIDEAHVHFGHPIMARDLALLLRVVRSKHGHIVMATQTPQEALKSDLATLLRDACPTKIALPNADADKLGAPGHPGPRDYLYMLGFGDEDIAIIKGATPKAEYYVKSGERCRLINFNFGPVTKALVCATGEEDVKRIRANPDWYKELVA